MSRKPSAIRRQFNRSAAGSYDIHAAVQRMMAERLSIFLKGWFGEGRPDEADILEIGCGTGALTEILVREWPRSSVTALDIAPAMIEAARQRIQPGAGSVRFLQADAEDWAANAPSASFDLIVSNACFQWLNDPSQTAGQLRRLLRDGGSLLFTTFGPDTFCELHQAFAEAYRAAGMEPQRHGLSFRSADAWRSLLIEAGFSRIQYEHTVQPEKYDSARDFLLAVKEMGASASEASASSGLSARRLFADMYKAYEDRFAVPGGVAATYDLLLIHAEVC